MTQDPGRPRGTRTSILGVLGRRLDGEAVRDRVTVQYRGRDLEMPREFLPLDEQLVLIHEEWERRWHAGARHRGPHKYRLLVNAPLGTAYGCEKCGKPRAERPA